MTKVYLVGHAPFIEDNRTRSFFATCAVKFYDRFIGPRTLNKFDKIIAISKWELPYWKKLGAEESKIMVVPNPIAKEFYTVLKTKVKEDVLFLGRVSPIKDIETLIHAAQLCPEVKFDIVGPVELEYGDKLNALIKELGVKNVEFKEPVYDVLEKIKIIDSHKVFVLPSIREAMPTALLEAQARGKICIGSENEGNREVLTGKPDSYLFKIGDHTRLAEIIRRVMK
jgi:glycosyltransferase involved in cell wall biosynthesis